jgi:hypothetical protein
MPEPTQPIRSVVARCQVNAVADVRTIVPSRGRAIRTAETAGVVPGPRTIIQWSRINAD